MAVEETRSEYSEKITDLLQVIDKLYYIKLYRVHLTVSRIRTYNLRDDRHCPHRVENPVFDPSQVKQEK
jgi:hypothetical protein